MADDNGWRPIAEAPEGVQMKVAHNLDPSSMKEGRYFNTTGVFKDGRWICNAAFVCIDGLLRWNPTHFRDPEPAGGAA
jgi:hypothetical protein